MNRFRSKLLALTVTVVLVCNLFPALDSFAAVRASGKCGENIRWSLDDNGKLTISGSGDMYDYEYYDEAPWVYDYSEDIETIVFSGNITSIGDCAFCYCQYVKSIILPDTVTRIGHAAFYECLNLSDIVLPDSVDFIGNEAFYYCNMSSFIIPDGVTAIGIRTFYGCSHLRSIVIPASVTKIGEYAFERCTNIYDVYYCGTQAQFGKIEAGDNPFYRRSVTIHYLGDTPFKIKTQPSNYAGAAGCIATFSVTAQGEGLAYQWQVYSNGAWRNSGATGAQSSKISFKVTNSHNGMKYRCIVSDITGKKLTSNTVSVSVVTPVTITKQPANVTGSVGDTATFSVTAQGSGLQYQWQMYSNGAWKNSGATGAKTNKISFKIGQSHNGMKYRCIITTSNGQKIYSNTATVKVVPAITIIKQPASISTVVGKTVAFNVTVQGDGLTYQWQMYSNGAWKNSGATGATTSKISFKTTKNHNGMKYRCVVKDKYGKKLLSNTATITVKQ
ncbi:MAG: leucine-rich repeat domain-containing protein [Clostridiales bacterium]|nr:leucine-rich repeat domain-containing protein [Clostridiales bacterium]